MSRICPQCEKYDVVDNWFDKAKTFLLWKSFGREVSDEKSASSTKGFAQGYQYGKNEDKELYALTIKHYKDEIDRLKILKDRDLERVMVRTEDVVSVDKGKVLIGYQPITDKEAEILKNEAEQYRKTLLYRVLHETTKQKAIEKGMILVGNVEELISAKAMLQSIEVQRGILNVCLGLNIKPSGLDKIELTPTLHE